MLPQAQALKDFQDIQQELGMGNRNKPFTRKPVWFYEFVKIYSPSPEKTEKLGKCVIKRHIWKICAKAQPWHWRLWWNQEDFTIINTLLKNQVLSLPS